MKRRARKTEASTAWKMLPVCAALLWPVSGYAQVTESRLSEWLLAHPPAPDDYPLGLSWRVPAEIPAQNLLRSNLLYHLSEDGRARKLPSETASRLYAWVALLPVTGRVPVAVADARWLQANLARDPVLQSDHNVVMPARPRTVTVITSAGQRCAVAHSAGYKAMDYIRVCESQQAGDWAWIVQPDGKIQRFGVASWNLEAQDEPAPGAWLWAGDWPEKLSEQLATFLATQGIAPDPDSTSDAEVVNDRSGVTLPPPADLSYRDMKVTASDWGSAGLLQSPTARMRPAGDFAVNMTRTTPYTNLNVFVQPFDWLEAGFRYTNVSNQLFGPAIAGNQSYKDKSIDLKFRLMKESAKLPQIAVGLKDISGTGLFSGEYFVASKRVNDFDFSLGIGWGYFGARGNLGNPLGSDTRPTVDTGQGGSFDFRQYFRGRTALFGGVQYQTPWDPLIVKLEYEGNNYQHEPFGNNLKQSSPWNLGLVYQLSDSVDVNFGVERGNTAMLGITLHTSLSKMSVPKLSDPPRVAVAPNRPEQKPDWAATSRDLTQQTNWPVQSITREGNDLRVTFMDAKANYWGDRVDRATSVLHRDAPAEIEGFTFNYSDSSAAPVLEQHVDRDTWVAGQTSAQPPSAQGVAVMDRAPTRPNPDEQLYQGKRPMLDGQLGMDFNYNLGGPDAFVLYQLAATAKGQIRLNDSTWIQGGVQFGVLDNYDKFNYDRPSNLPRVRTYMREYMVTSNFTMPNLQITHTGNLSESNYYSLYGGYLESMYAGVGGEWLYRPFQSSYAVGVDLNVVQQREFSQGFGFIDRNGLPNYRTVTGHATLYWDTGWNDLQATISAGRYLAKDSGITVGLSRVFSNGVKLTGGFTKTNVSAEQFGEGSFDKWITISIPFDAMLTRSGSTVV
ncbi:MAG: YjbH domain-containing protein, partial [Gallionellaceae bacterium]|nr:YjbH domain-containing protein [Gallionellaceae bacterium]